MEITKKQLLLYLAKCLTGSTLVFLAAHFLHYSNISWCIISVLLVLTPDSKEARPLAVTRIKANLIAAATCLLCLLVQPAGYLMVSVAFVLTIGLCYLFRIMAGSRSALAAVVIIMLHSPDSAHAEFWLTSLERMVSVLVGCLLALGITFAFHRRYPLTISRSTRQMDNE